MKPENTTYITTEQYYTLIGLQTLARQYNNQMRDLANVVRTITKEDDEWGHSSDYIYAPDNYDVKGLMERLNLVIKD